MRDFLEVMQEGEKIESSIGQRGRALIQNFDEKLVKFVDLITNKEGMKSHWRKALMKEAETTSDFPYLLGSVLERSLLAKYQIAKPEWRNYIKVGSQADFRAVDIIGAFGLQGRMSAVAEKGEYKNEAMREGKVSNTLSKYGKKFLLSWEALINDDLGAFDDIAERLANACLRTEYYNATALLVSSTAIKSTLVDDALSHPVMPSKTIDNKVTGALSETSLTDALKRFGAQTDFDGEPVLIEGYELVIPPALEFTALKILNSAALISVGVGNAAATTTSANVLATRNIRLNINPYLPIINTSTGDVAWLLFAKLSSGAAVQMNFLRGHENPEITMKAPTKLAVGGGAVSPMDGDFDNDSVEWRARHVMGGCIVDPIFVVGSPGS